MNPIIRADGNPKFAMVSTLAGAVINIILDPIFIFIFQWGMMGAAVATVIGQVATAALAAWYLLHMKIIKPASGDYALRGSICGRMLTLGTVSYTHLDVYKRQAQGGPVVQQCRGGGWQYPRHAQRDQHQVRCV